MAGGNRCQESAAAGKAHAVLCAARGGLSCVAHRRRTSVQVLCNYPDCAPWALGTGRFVAPLFTRPPCRRHGCDRRAEPRRIMVVAAAGVSPTALNQLGIDPARHVPVRYARRARGSSACFPDARTGGRRRWGQRRLSEAIATLVAQELGPAPRSEDPLESDRQRPLGVIRTSGGMTARELAELTGERIDYVQLLLRRSEGELRTEGRTRGLRYYPKS